MDNIGAFSSFGIAGLVILALVVIARWYLPIAEKNATARANYLSDIDANIHQLLLLATAWHAELNEREKHYGSRRTSDRSGDF